jgi:hypothetical protein
MFYGAFFAFPYPDLPPEKAAMYRLRTSVSMWSLFVGVVLIEISIVGKIVKALSKRLVSSLRKGLVGMAFLISGFLYSSYFALPIPNPPPQGMQWASHIFVSITLLIAGLGLLIMSICGKISANKALH